MNETVGKHIKPRRKGLFAHIRSIGFTNRLALYILALIAIGLFLGYKLAVMSITYGYMGQLLCFTVVFTPIGTVASIVLNSIVNKSKAENLSGDGTGIKFATAQQENFVDPTAFEAPQGYSENSPPI